MDAAAYETPAYVAPTSGKNLGKIIFTVGGKGGIGKTTTAIQLAHELSKAGLKTVLIDGNVGQPDLATYLRLAKAKSGQNGLPTIYDATLSGEMAAILTSEAINSARDDGADVVNFGLVAGAPADLNDPSVVNEDLYGRVIAFAQTLAEAVVIDTQIIESADRSGFVDRIIIPALLSGAHALALTDMSSAGVQNINQVFRQFINEEVDMDRVKVAINRVESSSMHVASSSDKFFAQMQVELVGAVAANVEIGELTNGGHLELDNPALTNMVRKFLGTVFGDGRFPLVEDGRRATPVKSKRKLWGRK